MSVPAAKNTIPIANKDQLVDSLSRGCKPKEDWRIGTEHEKFAFCGDSYQRLPYAGARGIRSLLEGLQQFGWQPVFEQDNLIGLTKNGASVSLEPGGQLELSGAPLETLHQTCDEVHTHLAEVKQVTENSGTKLVGLGFDPLWRRQDIPWMPKGRYDIMKAYLPTKGAMGLDMMLRTCTIQVNLDYASEADMIRKFRVGLALQPIATALFANSPFREGGLNGHKSLRSKVWHDTDPERTGMLPFVFEDGMSFERYVDYVLDVPMFFVYRDGTYIDASGQSFRDFLDGKLPALPGEKPTMGDWADHLTTIFPEVRLKTFLEMRGADGGPWRRICALPAFWVGLLYDQTALDAAWDLVKGWSAADRDTLWRAVPEQGLSAPFRDGTVRDVAAQAVAIARAGLKARNRLDRAGTGEDGFLNTLAESAETGRTQADEMIDAFNGPWQGDVRPLFESYAY